jgi:hypothetical protein
MIVNDGVVSVGKDALQMHPQITRAIFFHGGRCAMRARVCAKTRSRFSSLLLSRSKLPKHRFTITPSRPPHAPRPRHITHTHAETLGLCSLTIIAAGDVGIHHVAALAELVLEVLPAC